MQQSIMFHCKYTTMIKKVKWQFQASLHKNRQPSEMFSLYCVCVCVCCYIQ